MTRPMTRDMTRDLRIYCFVTDAFGGHGGIAVYNKDLLTAFTQHPRVAHVTALPRLNITRSVSAVSPIPWPYIS